MDYLFLNDGYVFMITCYSVFLNIMVLFCMYMYIYIYLYITYIVFLFLLQFVDLRFTALFLML